MVFWDVGNVTLIRQCLKDTRALVFVVDATDGHGIGNARLMLWKVMEEIEVENFSLIIVGNKIDESDAMTKEEVTDKLGLNFRSDWKVKNYSRITKKNCSISFLNSGTF